MFVHKSLNVCLLCRTVFVINHSKNDKVTSRNHFIFIATEINLNIVPYSESMCNNLEF